MSLLLLFNGSSEEVGPPIIAPAVEDNETVFLAYNNLADRSVIGGGSWLESLPLTNLKNRTLARVARATDLTLASTQLTISVPSFERWRVLALVNHNLRPGDKYRVRVWTNSAMADLVYDSAWQPVWPAVYDDIPWGAPNFWERTYTEAELAGYTWTLIHKLPAATYASFVSIELDTQSNPDGYFQFGRPFIADGYVPSMNMVVGASLGWEDESGVDQAYGGAEYFNELPKYRVARFTLAAQSVDEAYGKAFEIMRQAGRTGEVLLQWNPSDTKNAVRQSFVGRLRQLSPIEHPYSHLTSVAFEVQEARK